MSLQPTSIEVAVFDFDGTLTHADSFLPFLRYASGRWGFLKGMVVLTPQVTRFALRQMPNWELKEHFLTTFLGGRDLVGIQLQAVAFAKGKLPGLMNPAAMDRLRWHQAQGHRVVLLSASPELYLEAWARDQGITEVLGTKVETKEDRLTGRLLGENCYGEEKVRRLTEHLGDLTGFTLYAYGDSRGDLPLLNRSKHPAFRSFEQPGLVSKLSRFLLFLRHLV